MKKWYKPEIDELSVKMTRMSKVTATGRLDDLDITRCGGGGGSYGGGSGSGSYHGNGASGCNYGSSYGSSSSCGSGSHGSGGC